MNLNGNEIIRRTRQGQVEIGGATALTGRVERFSQVLATA
jgi:hypothetical protein